MKRQTEIRQLLLKFTQITIFLLGIGLILSHPAILEAPERAKVSPNKKTSQKEAEKASKLSTLGYREITAYTHSKEETDATPCITASGYDICSDPKDLNVAASNELPIGTEIRIGDRVFKVLDRMNSRYNYRIDILVDSKREAFRWGVQVREVEVLTSEVSMLK